MTTDPTTLTVDDLDALVACAAREAKLREAVYPKFVRTGRMTPDKADQEIRHMEAIAAILRHLRDRAAGVQELDFGV